MGVETIRSKVLGDEDTQSETHPPTFFLITAVPPGSMECEGHIIAQVVFYAKNVKS